MNDPKVIIIQIYYCTTNYCSETVQVTNICKYGKTFLMSIYELWSNRQALPMTDRQNLSECFIQHLNENHFKMKFNTVSTWLKDVSVLIMNANGQTYWFHIECQVPSNQYCISSGSSSHTFRWFVANYGIPVNMVKAKLMHRPQFNIKIASRCKLDRTFAVKKSIMCCTRLLNNDDLPSKEFQLKLLQF